jgi:hypothetical protein
MCILNRGLVDGFRGKFKMASAYCRNCGQQIDIAASFCTFCGAAQAVSSPPVEPARQPPPVMPTQASPPVRQLDQVGLPVIERFGAESQQADMGRALFPRPPSLHWALVFLFTLLTFGIFGWVWYFIQSSWVKKIDKRSNATAYFICALASWLLLVPMVVFSALANGQESLGISVAVLLLEVVAAVFMYCGFFSMAGSLRDEMPKRGVQMSIGGITLFFFTVLYVQGQMSWLAQWKDTGHKEPAPPKGIFWGLFAAFWGLVVAGLIFMVAFIGVSLPGFSRAQDTAPAAVSTGSTTIPQDVLPAPVVGESVTGMPYAGNAGDSAAHIATAAADAATVASNSTTDQATVYDLGELERQRVQAEAELERETLLQERKRTAEQQRRMDEQEQPRAYEDAPRQNASVEQQPMADELYESRRGECPGGFLGSDCRKRIRMEVCEGHWSSNPPLGYQTCRL